MPTGFLAVVAIALLGASAVAFVYRARPDQALRWTVAPLLVAAGLAVAWWAWPLDPLVAGFVWLPVVMGGLTIALVMAAVSRSGSGRDPDQPPLRGARSAARFYVGFLVAVLGVTLAATFA
jgi:hypothetical protein